MWIHCLKNPAKRHPSLSVAPQKRVICLLDAPLCGGSPASDQEQHPCVLARGSAVSPRREAGWCSGEGRRGGDMGVR